jgi:hypothetical protein
VAQTDQSGASNVEREDRHEISSFPTTVRTKRTVIN